MDSVLGTIVKMGGKIGLNVVCPGSGLIVDFTEAAYCLYNKDYFGATLNVASGMLDLATVGVFNAYKETAKIAAKNAAINTAKEASEYGSTKFLKEAAKQIAKGGAEAKAATHVATVASRKLKKDIGKKLAKEFSTKMIEKKLNKVLYDLAMYSTDDLLKETLNKAYIYNVLQNYTQNLTLDTVEDFLSEIVKKKAQKDLFTSATANAAEKAAKELLAGPFERIAMVTQFKAWVITILSNRPNQSLDKNINMLFDN